MRIALHGQASTQHSTENASEKIDFKYCRIFFNAGVVAFPCHDVDALRRADRGATHAGHTLLAAVFSLVQAVSPAPALGDGPLLFRPLEGNDFLLEESVQAGVFLMIQLIPGINPRRLAQKCLVVMPMPRPTSG